MGEKNSLKTVVFGGFSKNDVYDVITGIVEDKNKEIKALDKEVKALLQDKIELQKKNIDLTKELLEIEEENQRLNEKNSQMESEISSLQEKVRKLIDRMDRDGKNRVLFEEIGLDTSVDGNEEKMPPKEPPKREPRMEKAPRFTYYETVQGKPSLIERILNLIGRQYEYFRRKAKPTERHS